MTSHNRIVHVTEKTVSKKAGEADKNVGDLCVESGIKKICLTRNVLDPE